MSEWLHAPTAHPDELARVKMLQSYEVLDTEPEAAFDTLTNIAAEILGTSIALVSLVDEARQWFKSSVGLQASETPRDISFCGHAILGDDVMVVPDAHLDPRFANNPLVTGGPRIRLYAGAPLVAANGLPLGTLCVIDDKPRELSESQVRVLRALADQVQAHLELRAVNRGLREALQARISAEQELTHQANHDQLTGLANRRLFFDRLSRHCTDGGIGLVYIDLDGFKSINDTLGHHAGDMLLVICAERLVAASRDTDVVARLGGDEFAIITSHHQDALPAIARRIHEQFELPAAIGGQLIALSASIGTTYVHPGADPNEVLNLADGEMYIAKRARSRRSDVSGSSAD